MDDIINRLRNSSDPNDYDFNLVSQQFAANPYRQLLNSIFIERKDILRTKLNVGMAIDNDGKSSEIDNILRQLRNPKFPIIEGCTESDEEWIHLEKKYFDGIQGIKLELENKLLQIDEGQKKALDQIDAVLRNQGQYRPIDERDRRNARESVVKRFDQARMEIKDECASRVLVLQRNIEQQGRKRRNFDKKTTDILQDWFNNHRQNPYPTDHEKAELAKTCGIKITQVNNWFGNQRIRSKQQIQRLRNDEVVPNQMEHPPIVEPNSQMNYHHGYLPQMGNNEYMTIGQPIPDQEQQNQDFYGIYGFNGMGSENDVYNYMQ